MKPVTFLLLSCVRGSLGEMMLSWSNYYLGIYSIQVCLVWHYILFLSEDCTTQWFCIFSGHFLLPCLLMTLLFCPFLYFLYPTVKHRVSQDTCSSLSGHATLDFLCTLKIWMAPQILMTLRTVSPAQPWFRFKSIYWAPSMCQEVLLSRQRGTLSKWSLILIALTELRCWPLCFSLCPLSPAACPYSIILTLTMLGLNNLL